MRLEHWIYTIPLRLRALFHRNRLNAELDEELRDHLERQIEFNRAGGMSPEKARLVALRQLVMRRYCAIKQEQPGTGAAWIGSCTTFALGFES